MQHPLEPHVTGADGLGAKHRSRLLGLRLAHMLSANTCTRAPQLDDTAYAPIEVPACDYSLDGDCDSDRSTFKPVPLRLR